MNPWNIELTLEEALALQKAEVLLDRDSFLAITTLVSRLAYKVERP